MSLQTDLEDAVAQVQADSDTLKAIVNGPATGDGSTVTTDSGDVDTVAKAIADLEAEFAASAVVSQATAARDAAIDAQAGAEAARDEAQGIVDAGGVKISANDTTAGDVETKLLAGDGIAMSTQNDGENETRTVAIDPGNGLKNDGGKVVLDIDGIATEVTDIAADDKVPVFDTSGSVVGWVSAANMLSVIGNMTEESGVDGAADWVPFFDAGVGPRKAHPNDLVTPTGWDFVERLTGTAAASIETSTFTAGYDYLLVFRSGWLTSSAGSLLVQVYVGGSWLTSGYSCADITANTSASVSSNGGTTYTGFRSGNMYSDTNANQNYLEMLIENPAGISSLKATALVRGMASYSTFTHFVAACRAPTAGAATKARAIGSAGNLTAVIDVYRRPIGS